MMSLDTIIAINEEIAARAAARRLRPFAPDRLNEVDRWPPFPFPNIGPYEPPGWERTDAEWFIDKTGRGAESELALTADQFRNELRDYISANPGHGFAIVEEGPFQAMIAAFCPVHHPRSDQHRTQYHRGNPT